ncbi:MAG: flagellar biosynthesis anti-sigma factor FlgM [Desulfobacteraceae bacterium]|nr:flagellar biosynthesis anti-sigma factor FlgM [Desulfobacteraceae bacterium]
MKITSSYFRDTVTRLKPAQEKTEKTGISDQKITDRVTIGAQTPGKTGVESMSGYSPENLKMEGSTESRTEKIQRLKNEISSGTYNISSEKVAEKMIGVHINDLI